LVASAWVRSTSLGEAPGVSPPTSRPHADVFAAPSSSAPSIDTADPYGPRASQRLIAEAVRPHLTGPLDRNQGRLSAARPGVWQPNRRRRRRARRATETKRSTRRHLKRFRRTDRAGKASRARRFGSGSPQHRRPNRRGLRSVLPARRDCVYLLAPYRGRPARERSSVSGRGPRAIRRPPIQIALSWLLH
jgi:hypothetical protein